MSDAQGTGWLDRMATACRLSLAGYVAICIAAVLIALTIAAWVAFDAEPQRVAWGDYISWPQIFMLGICGCLSCVLGYWAVRFWSEDVPVRDNELAQAWQAGLEAIRKRGIALNELPLFLVLGCKEEQSQSLFVKQCGLTLAVAPTPASPVAPLRWFIAHDRILLFCSDIGAFSGTQSRLALLPQDAVSSGALANLERFSVSQIFSASEGRASPQNAEVCTRQTDRLSVEESKTVELMLNSEVAGYPSDESQQVSNDYSISPSQNASLPGAVVTERTSSKQKTATYSDASAMASLEAAESLVSQAKLMTDSLTPLKPEFVIQPQHNASLLSSKETIRYQSLLADTCRMLRVARADAAPINGMIAWIDGPQLMNHAGFARQCGQALRRDCTQIQMHLGLLAPITMVVDQMQEVAGFPELIRRCGPENSYREVLGEALDLQRLPDATTLLELCSRAIRALSSSVYKCLQANHQLGQPGSQRLFQLVISGRGKLGQALSSLVVESMGMRDQDHRAAPNMLSGLYFTASGDKPPNRGFGHEVLERMMNQQELLHWTAPQQQREARYRHATMALASLTFALALLAVGQIMHAAL